MRGSDDARLFSLFVYICIVVRDTIIREVDIPLTGSHSNMFVTSKPGPGFSKVKCHGRFWILLFKVTGGCSYMFFTITV